MLATSHTLSSAPRANVDQRSVHVTQTTHGAVTRVSLVTRVRPQLTHQLAVNTLGSSHRGHGHPLGPHAHWGRGSQVLEGPAVAPGVVVLVLTQARGPGVVAGAGGAVLTCTLVTLTTHGLRVRVSRLVSTTHALPLPQPVTNNP